MGASRKLQGEIDRVLKKVQEGVDVFESIWNKVYDTENANQKEKFEADLKKEIKKLQRYRDQIKTWIQSSEIKDKKALMDARKQIEREMERFKVCEKETKTKAFSKEGLVQQPKTDPKEKAKSETRDWLNSAVGDLESQIDNFEAEIEALSVKKGKARPPRLTHLETSITRHKAHIMKLELILRLLDNDGLSPEQVNDVKDFIDDYVERNQDDFDEFSDVDELYSSLPLDKVDSLEDLVSVGTSVLVKGVGSVSTATTGPSMKNSLTTSPGQTAPPLSSSATQNMSVQDQAEDAFSIDINSDATPRTPSSKTGNTGAFAPTASSSIASVLVASPNLAATASNAAIRSSAGGPSAVLSGTGSVRAVADNSVAVASSAMSALDPVTEDDNINLLSRRAPPAASDISRGIGRGSLTIGVSNQTSSIPVGFGSVNAISGMGALASVPTISDIPKRNVIGADEKIGIGSLSQPLASPLNGRIVPQQIPKSGDVVGSSDVNNTVDGVTLGGRVFPSVGGVQWRPQSASSFQNPNETGQFRGRAEIAPDQREKFLQRFQQVQQQGPSNLINMSHFSSTNQKHFSSQQQSPLLQQIHSQSSTLSTQVGLGLGVQPQGLPNATSAQQQSHLVPISSGANDSDLADRKVEEQRINSPDGLNIESSTSSGVNKSIMNEDDLKSLNGPSVADCAQLPRDSDLTPGKTLQISQSSGNLGVIGRRSILDLGAIGDSTSGLAGSSGGLHDQIYNLQMLEAAYYKLPQPKDSERTKKYIPRHPAITPASYPQSQAPLFENSAFWERLSLDASGPDILFFAFYYQQNTYQQYLAARELKRQSWRYHRKYNTWFQRHEEPNVTNEDYEQGAYVYFDFHVNEDSHGWCQRIKNDFTFEYSFLEDELTV